MGLQFNNQIERFFTSLLMLGLDKSSISTSQHFISTHLPSVDPPIARGSEYPDSSSTSHLFSDGRRPDTAFQRYRNSRLSGEFHSEITGRSLSECLDECLRQTSFQCRSAVYSEHYHTCRLSRFNQRDGHRIIYDADYDYYENLMRKCRKLRFQFIFRNRESRYSFENRKQLIFENRK